MTNARISGQTPGQIPHQDGTMPKLHHLGIVLPDLDAAQAYMEIFGHIEA